VVYQGADQVSEVLVNNRFILEHPAALDGFDAGIGPQSGLDEKVARFDIKIQ